ncbi:hypothetical protein [Ruegeria faecimaris]|uniref:hypothetical protein n=1 Tax=Ruegeria faecimaris TaxID=686389 RepID=UPI002490813F|nr:hypothetical protein [Ruegeria faecimaris]
MAEPVIKIVEGPSPTQKGVSEAITVGLAGVLSAGSVAADIMPFDREQLFGVMHFRLQEALQAQRRARWFGGKIYNRFSGQDPNYVLFSGTHLGQTLALARIQTPDFVVPRGKYLLRLDYVKEAYENLKQERKGAPV